MKPEMNNDRDNQSVAATNPAEKTNRVGAGYRTPNFVELGKAEKLVRGNRTGNRRDNYAGFYVFYP